MPAHFEIVSAVGIGYEGNNWGF